MPVIRIRPRAKIDLAEIWDYIAEDNEARADSFVSSIDQKFQVLANQPALGRARDELVAGLRSFPTGRYVIYYQAMTNGVDIVRVLHGARDVEAVSFQDDD